MSFSEKVDIALLVLIMLVATGLLAYALVWSFGTLSAPRSGQEIRGQQYLYGQPGRWEVHIRTADGSWVVIHEE